MPNRTDRISAGASRGTGHAFILALLVANVFACSGCLHRTLKPVSLPRHLVAKTTHNAKTIDLSQLASDTTSEEIIVPGDVLEVSIAAGLATKDTVEISTRVDEQGYAELPQIGKVNLSGLELDAAESTISTRSIQQGIYRAPHVTVTMKQPKMVRVTVTGAVDKPGTYELRPGSSDLLHALVVAGSLADDAGTNVEIRQPGVALPGKTTAPLVAGVENNGSGTELVNHEVIDADPVSSSGLIKVDLTSLGRSRSTRQRLRDGAIVYVERRDPAPISIGGLVRRADRYDYPVGENLHLLDAISMAGGESNAVADKVFVIREVEHGGRHQREVIQVSLTKAKHNEIDNILLAPGDVVTVEKTVGTVLLEAVKSVGFGVSAGLF